MCSGVLCNAIGLSAIAAACAMASQMLRCTVPCWLAASDCRARTCLAMAVPGDCCKEEAGADAAADAAAEGLLSAVTGERSILDGLPSVELAASRCRLLSCSTSAGMLSEVGIGGVSALRSAGKRQAGDEVLLYSPAS